MDLEGILAISGKPGLYKMVAQSRGGVIVESLTEGKRFPVSQANKISALKDIAIYTVGEEVPLADVYQKIAEREDYGRTLEVKDSTPDQWREYMEKILPAYDRDRVYNSDLKKLLTWYNLLHEHGYIKPSEAAEDAENQEEEKNSESGEAENSPDEDKQDQ